MKESEEAARKFMIDDLTQAIQEVFPSAQVRPFGSYPVSLSTFLSDVDVTVEQLEQPAQSLSQSSGNHDHDHSTSKDVEAAPSKRRRTTETTAAADHHASTGIIPADSLDMSQILQVAGTRDNKVDGQPSAVDTHTTCLEPQPQQVIDLTHGDTSSGSEQETTLLSRKRHRTLPSDSCDHSDSDSLLGYTLSVDRDHGSGSASDSDYAEAYALADAFDSENDRNNSRLHASISAEAAHSQDNDRCHRKTGSAASSDNSKTSFSTASTEETSTDSLQQLADLDGISTPVFVYAIDEPRLEKIARLPPMIKAFQDVMIPDMPPITRTFAMISLLKASLIASADGRLSPVI